MRLDKFLAETTGLTRSQATKSESEPKMLINYETSSNKEITLTFIRQENGQYLLSNLSK